MIANDFLKRIVDPALQFTAPFMGIPVTDEARVLLMTIAGQESNWAARLQVGGPARSYWQFEKGGGVAGVFAQASGPLQKVCWVLDIPFDEATVFEAMAWNDTLACVMARLLLWTDPAPLPWVGDKRAGWEYYLRNWRPGMPHPDGWETRYDQSLAAMR